MKRRKVFYLIGAVTLVALAVFVVVLIRSTWFISTDEIAIPKDSPLGKKQNTSASKIPVRIAIPVLKVNAKISQVGINKKGNMAVPSNFTDVGWYKYGSAPGEDGNAVMAGHVDNGLALPGVFKHLEDLKKGDDVYVKMEDGKVFHYIVSYMTTYDYDAKVDEVFAEKGTPSLKLITCTGVWVPSYRTHDKRLVVTAIQKESFY